MGRIRYYVAAAGTLLAIMILIQGCQKAATVTQTPVSDKQTASVGRTKTAKPDKPKPEPVSTSTADTVKPKKPAGKAPAPKPSEDPAFAPKSNTLPTADIDSHDPKYQEIRDGKPVSPKIEANGKPVTVLYLPPYMFTVTLTKGGQEKVYLTFGTVTATSDAGNRLEVHVLARRAAPEGSKFDKVAVIYSDKTSQGQTWSKNAAGMDITIQALGYGEWKDSPVPGSGMGWVKLKVSAK